MDPSTPATTQTVQPTGQKTMNPVGAPELTAEEQKKREWGVDLDVDGQPMVGKKGGASVGCCIGWD